MEKFLNEFKFILSETFFSEVRSIGLNTITSYYIAKVKKDGELYDDLKWLSYMFCFDKKENTISCITGGTQYTISIVNKTPLQVFIELFKEHNIFESHENKYNYKENISYSHPDIELFTFKFSNNIILKYVDKVSVKFLDNFGFINLYRDVSKGSYLAIEETDVVKFL